MVTKIQTFLDVTGALIDGQIETGLYIKSTDSHQSIP